MITVRPAKDKPVELVKLVELLEKEVGFQPVTEVALELQGRVLRRNGKLVFEVGGTRQTFVVEKVEGESDSPRPEGQLLTAVASLVKADSPDRLVLRQWKAAAEKKPSL
ncbi:MAG: hypothetical protein M1453_13640 [Acidobacteria bacterium]|nr:hypothetical protein [Acidobacteriota bacterium]MCL5289021.1 hypothetical protein [Acidobacteriota bacterium]